jgi:hypothetical protein
MITGLSVSLCIVFFYCAVLRFIMHWLVRYALLSWVSSNCTAWFNMYGTTWSFCTTRVRYSAVHCMVLFSYCAVRGSLWLNIVCCQLWHSVVHYALLSNGPFYLSWFVLHCLAHRKRCLVPPSGTYRYRTVPRCIEPLTLNILPGTGTMTATIYCK